MDASPSLVLLGSPHLRRAAARFDLPDALPGYLMAYLAMRADWVLREELAVLLWPEAAQEEAQNNLRVNLARLRPHLARLEIGELFIAERRRLRLDLRTDVASLRAACKRGEWSATAQAMSGQFLAGFGFRAFPVLGEWARAERESLRGLWRDAVLRAAQGLAPSARLDLAAHYLGVDPLDEEVVRIQLGALAQLGRPADAQRAFAEFDTRARDEFGVGATITLSQYAHRLVADGADPSPSETGPGFEGPLVGREVELAALSQRVIESPLVSVVGLGGVGKTRLARAVAEQAGVGFSGGVVWVSLVGTSDVSEISRRAGDELGVAWSGGRNPTDQLAEHVGDRHLLLVIDNVEQFLADSAALLPLLDRLLARCPHLHLLVTTREPLHHPREIVFRLDCLPVPGEGAGLASLGSPAVQLFVQQAQRFRPTFDPRTAADTLGEIARLTGGMPLALRLAAAWMAFLSCADIAAEIRRGLDALEPRERQASGVRATLQRTWDRLAQSERAALANLAVFANPFSAQAAREVAQASLPVLGSLVERALLVHAQPRDDGERRHFDMHPLVRALAAEYLAADPAAMRLAKDRHASHVARLLAPWANIWRVDQTQAVRVVGRLLPELLAAWQWSLATGRADFIALAARALSAHFALKGRWDDAIRLYTEAESQLDPERPAERAALVEAVRARAGMLYRKGHHDMVEADARRAIAWARTIDHTFGLLTSLNVLGLALTALGRRREAIAAMNEALELARAYADPREAAPIVFNNALLLQYEGDFAEAESLLREVVAMHRESGQWRSLVYPLNSLALQMESFSRYEEAQALVEEGLRLCDEHAFVGARAVLRSTLSSIHCSAGRFEAAAIYADLALADAGRGGETKAETASLLLKGQIFLHQQDLGSASPWLFRGLQMARSTGEISNELGALALFALWCEMRGRHADAALARQLVLDHPRLDALLRRGLDKLWGKAARDASEVAAAKQAAQRTDAQAMLERALAEWGAEAAGGAAD